MRHLSHYQETRKYRLKKVAKHSLKVFASGGVWYLSTWIHDSPQMLLIAFVAMAVQTLIEEMIGE